MEKKQWRTKLKLKNISQLKSHCITAVITHAWDQLSASTEKDLVLGSTKLTENNVTVAHINITEFMQ